YEAGRGQTRELQRVLEELSAMPGLVGRERRQVEALRRALLIRQVDDDRKSGELRRAMVRLEPALKAAPADATLLAALARLEASSLHPKKALDIFLHLIERDPKNLALIEEAAAAAIASGERTQARKLASAALDLHPLDARAYLIAGRVAVARGDDHSGYR